MSKLVAGITEPPPHQEVEPVNNRLTFACGFFIMCLELEAVELELRERDKKGAQSEKLRLVTGLPLLVQNELHFGRSQVGACA